VQRRTAPIASERGRHESLEQFVERVAANVELAAVALLQCVALCRLRIFLSRKRPKRNAATTPLVFSSTRTA
jgi:hypothetical protein